MSGASRLIVVGMVIAIAGLAGYMAVDWGPHLEERESVKHALRSLVLSVLNISWYGAWVVAGMLGVGGIYRFATSRGARLTVAWKLFAYVTLWAIGSFAFFFGIFVAYAPEMGQGGTELLVPVLLGGVGYLLIGLGFVASIMRKE